MITLANCFRNLAESMPPIYQTPTVVVLTPESTILLTLEHSPAQQMNRTGLAEI